MNYPLARPLRLSLDSFASRVGVHPEVVRRWVALGLLEPTRDAAGRLWFAPAQVHTVARIQRLRAGLAVNYAALGLVLDLLDRVEMLEAALRGTGTRPPRPPSRLPSATVRGEEPAPVTRQ